jgi:DNA-binding IscR family transcriptional regulator
MLTQKTRYAILALTKLSKEYQKKTLTISEIAKAKNCPRGF